MTKYILAALAALTLMGCGTTEVSYREREPVYTYYDGPYYSNVYSPEFGGVIVRRRVIVHRYHHHP